MKNDTVQVRRWIAVLGLVFGLSLVPQFAGAQGTVPPVPTPGQPIPTAVPTPEPPSEITTDDPLIVPVNPQIGLSVVVTSTGSGIVVSIAIPPETLQNLTDINGNPVVAGRLEIRPFTQDQATVLGELPTAALADTATLDQRLGDVIRIRLYDAAGNVIPRPNFNPPVTLCLTPTAEQIAFAGSIDNIVITTYDTLIGAWTRLTTTVFGNQLCSSITHLSFFILSAREPVLSAEPTPVPPQPIPARLPNTAAAGTPDAWLPVLLVLLALSLGWWLRRSVR